MKWEVKKNLFDTLRKVLGVFLLVSVAYYFLFFIGLPLPHSSATPGEESRVYDNYFLFVILPNELHSLRFMSVFLEPGYLGCLLALLLYAGKYKFNRENWYNWIFAIALFFTLSLAGWGLTFLGLFLNYMRRNKLRTITKFFLLIVLGFAVIGSGFYFKSFNNGNNIINESIIERLEYDENSGTISGYQRTNEALSYYFLYTFLNSDYVWLGVDNPDDTIEGDAADWTVFVICYGFIGLAGFILFLITSIFIDKKNRYQRFCLVLLYALMFFQTVYGIYWLIYISVLLLGLTSLSEEYLIESYKKSNNAVRVSSK